VRYSSHGKPATILKDRGWNPRLARGQAPLPQPLKTWKNELFLGIMSALPPGRPPDIITLCFSSGRPRRPAAVLSPGDASHFLGFYLVRHSPTSSPARNTSVPSRDAGLQPCGCRHRFVRSAAAGVMADRALKAATAYKTLIIWPMPWRRGGWRPVFFLFNPTVGMITFF